MKNTLYTELTDLGYTKVTDLDIKYLPETVTIYLRNVQNKDERIVIEFLNNDIQLPLQNQNPTLSIVDTGETTVCLSEGVVDDSFIPTIIIDNILDIIDPSYPRSITFTGTINRYSTFIPNIVLVTYNGVEKQASIINNSWTISFDLFETDKNTLQTISVKGNSINTLTNVVSEYSQIKNKQFNIIITPQEEGDCIPSINTISCLCLDVTKDYKVTVDGESFSGSFEDVVAFLDSHNLYSYPSGLECNPCDGNSNKISTKERNSIPTPSLMNFSVMSEHIFTLLEDGKEPLTITLDGYLSGYRLFRGLFNSVPDIQILESFTYSEYITQYKNISPDRRNLKFVIESTDTKSALGLIEYDDFTKKITYTDNSFSICFLPSVQITCESSTSPIAAFDNMPNMNAEAINLQIFCNNEIVSLQDIEANLAPFELRENMYGIEFVNRTEECLLIEFRYEGNELFFPSSTTLGIESESLPGLFRLSLAPQVFAPVQVKIEFIDSTTRYVTTGILNESQHYEVNIQAISNNPAPNWNGIVTYQGNEYTLSANENVMLNVLIPSNKSWVQIPYQYDFDVVSAYGFTFEGGSKPGYNISSYSLESGTSTWKYYEYSQDIVNTTGRHFYNSPTTYSKENNLQIQLDPIYSGLTTGAPFNATVNGSGLLVVNLGDSYPYNDGWTTDSKTSQSFSLKNVEGTPVAIFAYYVYLDDFRLLVETKDYPGVYTSESQLIGKVNTPFTKLKLGPFPNVTKVYINIHQDGFGGASLVRGPTYLDVVDDYAYYTPPTPTETYNPYVSDLSYRITNILVTVSEGDPLFIRKMRQSIDFKYIVNA